MNTDFIRYLTVKEALTGKKIIQRGGVVERLRLREHTLDYDVTSYNGHTIELMAIAIGKSDDKKPCFIMSITPGGAGILISLNRGMNCWNEQHDMSSDVLLAAMEIAKQKGATTFTFTDMSTKLLGDKKISLADLSFLTTGRTWYERFLPIIPLDEVKQLNISKWRRVIETNSWDDVNRRLLEQGVEVFIDTSIDTSKPGSAMKVLAKAKASKTYHEFFYMCMDQLLIASMIPIMKGMDWTMNL
jgi:hypothetical protein